MTKSTGPHPSGHPCTGHHRTFLQRLAQMSPWFVGVASLIWFIIRVGPRPSRAAYPCQQAAIATIGGFFGWLAGTAALSVLLKKAWRDRTVRGLLTVMTTAGALVVWMLLGAPPAPAAAAPPWTPTDPPNSPMGTARGIFPGRVVWAHYPGAAAWNGDGHWWDMDKTDPAAVDDIVSSAIRQLTGRATEESAWDALFTHFNKSRGRGTAGYTPGERIAIKINQNTARDGTAENGCNNCQNRINGLPVLILSLLRSLVEDGGVAQEDIMVYDASRYIGDSIYLPCHAAFPGVRFMEEKPGDGREVALWTENAIAYPDTPEEQVRMTTLATQVIDATYLINMAIMKSHGADVATLCGKNHWGSVRDGRDHYWINGDRPMGSYSPIVSMMGHHHLGAKTLLFMIDTIYAANGSDSEPTRWNMPPFKGDWPDSLFISEDGVAIDSVGFDFENNEWGLPHNTDNYLHEAALADDPPSGTFYAPDPDAPGQRLPSLGVHEHWNNVTDKQYSRNLDPVNGTGIELVYINAQSCNDGARNGAEEEIDCGGGCPPCADPTGGDADTDSDADGDADTDTDNDADGDSDADADIDADGDADTDGDSDGDADMDTDSDSVDMSADDAGCECRQVAPRSPSGFPGLLSLLLIPG